MHRLYLHIFALAALGLIYWQIVCLTWQVTEPWDAPVYWTVAYPLAVAVSGVVGWFLRSHGWLSGTVINLAQMPIILLNSSMGALAAVGLLFMILLTVPAAALSAWTGRLAQQRQDA